MMFLDLLELILSKRSVLLFLLLINMVSLYGQQSSNVDSLKTLLLETTDERKIFDLWYKIGSYYDSQEINIDSAYWYHKKANEISHSLKNDTLKMISYIKLGLAFFDGSRYEEATECYQHGHDLAVSLKDTINQLRTLNNLALIWDVKGRFSEAINMYREILDIGLLIGHEMAICASSVNLSMMMTSLKKWEEGAIAAQQAIEYNKRYNNEYGLGIAYNNLSLCQRFLGDYEGSIASIKRAREYAIKTNSVKQLSRFYMNMSGTFLKMGMPDSALYYSKNGIEYTQDYNLPYENLKGYRFQGEALLALGKAKEAQRSVDEAMRISRETGALEEISKNHDLSLKIAIYSNQTDKALDLLDSVEIWNDKIFNDNLSKDLAESEAKYENEKLKNELLVKEKNLMLEQSKRTSMLYSLFGISGLTIISLIMGTLWLKARSRKAKLEVEESFNRELINEIDQFRKRVSRTLHDDLGQELLHIKGSLEKKGFDRGVAESIHKIFDHIRALSRDQYPYQIEYIGLGNALSELFENMEKTSEISISDQVNIEEEDLDNAQAKHIYYVIQELIRNSIKHSDANKVRVSLQKAAQSIQLKYLENGSYFDFKEELKKTKHLGLKLIKQRIRILDGNILYEHNEDGYNEFTITFPI